MADTRRATTRLRRAFRYPHDSSSDAEPDAMDEQGTPPPAPRPRPPADARAEQQALIARLAAQNASRNTAFRRALVALALVAALPYLVRLARRPAAADAVLVSFLSLTSLLATACLLHRLPPAITGIAPLDAWSAARPSARPPARDPRRRRRLPAALDSVASPLQRYLPYLNVALVTLLALMGLVPRRASADPVSLGTASFPALVYGLALASKLVMASVDPERDLSALQYQYKGA